SRGGAGAGRGGEPRLVDVGPRFVGDVHAHRSAPALAAAAGPAAPVVPVVPVLLVFVPLVRIDDVADPPVPDYVVAGQPGEVDVADALQDLLDLAQPALLAVREVNL